MNTEWERFSFSSPAIPKAHQGKGLSRPRMTKLRKQSSLGSKPPSFSVIEPGLEGNIIDNLDKLSIHGMRTEIHSLEDDLSNLDINAFRDSPFEFGSALNGAMKNLNIDERVDAGINSVSDGNIDPDNTSLNDEMRKMNINESVVRDIDLNEEIKESATSDNDSNEELRKMDAKESDDLNTVDINAFCSLRLNGEMEKMDVKEKLKLGDEEMTPNRFVFTSNQSTKTDKAPIDENLISKPTRAKHKKKGTKQKVHLWSGIDFVSSETKSEDAFSPMDISPSTVSDNQESEDPVTPVVETAPAFTFSSPLSSPLRSQRKKFPPSVDVGADECEKWRLKGNSAYKSGDLARAEEFYKEGINSVPNEEASRSCLRALMLCYSNLAATHMSLGRIRDALRDCQEAAFIDPTFYKVQLRAATCHLLLGQVEEAVEHFRRCLSESDVCVDRKIAVEASDGLQRVEKFVKLCAQVVDNSDREAALEAASDALSISPYCEKIHETKAEILFAMRRYDAVVAYTQDSLDSAENNSPPNDSSHRRWRFRLAFLSNFHLGKLEDALSLVESGKYGVVDGPMSSLVSTVKDLVRHKAAGNEAMQAGKPSSAIEHYTSAISLNTESRPFAAICFFNRAAAHKSLGNVIDAIADCNLAIALDGNYIKALSRRAMLYEMIRDYSDAANDLRRVVSSSCSAASERGRLLMMEEEARREVPLDLYMILGIDTSASNAEVKKAYRKAALRYHPDKAGKVLESVGREIGEEVRQSADRLFKRIGEAYAVLSDPFKRAQYDQEEEIRNLMKHRGGSNASQRRDGRRSYA